MIIELHMLQNVSPACLNRDDNNTPKDAEFGGVRRARISSQCLKRAIRTHFKDTSLLTEDQLSTRTKKLVEKELLPALTAQGKSEPDAIKAISGAFSTVDLKLKDNNQSEYLLFLGDAEKRRLLEVITQHFDKLVALSASTGDAESSAKPKKKKSAESKDAAIKKAMEGIFDGGQAVDLALFGRMLANIPKGNVDAACQVAHAISTNRLAMDVDFFTAVDDLQESSDDEGAGAGMIGNVEFNSSCFYRYACIDVEQLKKNLQGDEQLSIQAVEAFLKASIEALPSGKQNTMAAHNPPSFVMAVVRPNGQWNLANAFVRPVKGNKFGLVADSVGKLDEYWGQLTKMYSNSTSVALATTESEQLNTLKPHDKTSVATVIQFVVDAMKGAGK